MGELQMGLDDAAPASSTHVQKRQENEGLIRGTADMPGHPTLSQSCQVGPV